MDSKNKIQKIKYIFFINVYFLLLKSLKLII